MQCVILCSGTVLNYNCARKGIGHYRDELSYFRLIIRMISFFFLFYFISRLIFLGNNACEGYFISFDPYIFSYTQIWFWIFNSFEFEIVNRVFYVFNLFLIYFYLFYFLLLSFGIQHFLFYNGIAFSFDFIKFLFLSNFKILFFYQNTKQFANLYSKFA